MKQSAVFKETRTYDPIAKKHRIYQTAVCSKCGAIENEPITSGKPLPPPPLIKHFQARGWVMGSSRNHDVCPECLKEAAENKRKAAAAVRYPPAPLEPLPKPQTATILSMTAATKEQAPMNTMAPEPRQPDRESKRLIVLSIENAYLGPDKGYSPGHNDESVARSLNVPVKWVADIREEFFGPVVNPEVAALKVLLGAQTVKLDSLERELRDVREKVMNLKERIHKIEGGR